MSTQYVLFDFDGTISTLRHGWEQVMQPYFMEILGVAEDDDKNVQMIERYIDESTGIQTAYQMQWLKDTALAMGVSPILDVWDYKHGYNQRILQYVQRRKQRIASGEERKEAYLMQGSEAFLQALCDAGCALFVASGTDHQDVCKEVEFLGLTKYFRQITGAPEDSFGCSKEKVIRDLLNEQGICGEQLTVIGDGKVEIALAKKVGAFAIGIASDEQWRTGINPQKQKRLIDAGADQIIGDFMQAQTLLATIRGGKGETTNGF